MRLIMWLAIISMSLQSRNNRGAKITDIALQNGSQLNLYLSNYGKFGQTPDDSPGAWWPSDRYNETYIFGAGLWIGAITSSGDTLVSFGYNPNNARSEMVPSHILGNPLDYQSALQDPYDRVHIYGVTTQDYPWPLKTQDGKDSTISFQDSYTMFTDADTSYQESGSSPLNVVILQQTYTFHVTTLENAVFFHNRIYNYNQDTLYKVYLGINYDFDIGNETATNANDLVGFKRTYDFPDDSVGPIQLNLAYQYQIDPEPGWIGVDGNGLPGVIGSVFLKSPLATDTVVIWDTIGTQIGPDTVIPGQPLGMTAFKIFTVAVDPTSDPERYTLMAGYDLPQVGGAYNPYMDDVYGPGDKRFIQVSGPFTLAPADSCDFDYAIVIGRDTNEILDVARIVKETWTSNFHPSNLLIGGTIKPETVSVNDTVLLKGWAYYEREIDSMVCVIQTPSETTIVHLFDDGNHEDVNPNDNIFANHLILSDSGEYAVLFKGFAGDTIETYGDTFYTTSIRERHARKFVPVLKMESSITTKNMINIYSANRVPEDFTVRIYNTLGEEILSRKFLAQHQVYRLDISKLPRGLYFVEIKGKNKLLLRNPLVKLN